MTEQSSRPAQATSRRREPSMVTTKSTLALGAPRLHLPASAGAQDAASPVRDVCVLTPEMTEGPYSVPFDLVRADITEGRPGLPLRLQVVDLPDGCAPLIGAAVDIWHCDAQGYYSGVSGSPGGGANPEAGGAFPRGIQPTTDGVAESMIIYPGWYVGGTVHIQRKGSWESSPSESILRRCPSRSGSMERPRLALKTAFQRT